MESSCSHVRVGLRVLGYSIAAVACLWRPLAAQSDVRITEFLAVNDGIVVDENDDASDFIEVHNAGVSAVDLDGWFLTDDPAVLLWQFPAVTLAPGDFLLVFASGKDRRNPDSELHTNFRLAGDGDYLAIAEPDGTIVHEFAPTFPTQREDVSYGIGQTVEATELVGERTAVRVLVPSGGGDGLDWTERVFDDASWRAGTTGVGYDTDDTIQPAPGESRNLAIEGLASQSSTLGGFVAGLGIDGDPGNFTHTAAGQNLPATWELDLQGTFPIASIVLHNRDGCCASRLRDITVFVLDESGNNTLYESDLLNPENELGGPDEITINLVEELGGGVNGGIVRVVRTPDPDLSGTGGAGNSDEPDVLSLGEVEVWEGASGYGRFIGTDVEAEMSGEHATAYLRIPFDVADPADFDLLTLRMRYDDGFVAYVNGMEVARRNAPDSPAWNSSASGSRSDSLAVVYETINVTSGIDALVAGTNILAIHGLNTSTGSSDFLIAPLLEGASLVGGGEVYFLEPTPGAPNDKPGFAGFVGDTTFSLDRGFYSTPFDVEITTSTEGASIRYTFDGTEPTPTRGFVYSGPITIDTTTNLRAIAYKSGLEPSNVDAQTYIFLDEIVVQDRQATLDRGFPSSWGSTSADYGMDPDVIGQNGTDRYGGKYTQTIRDDLLAVPTVSIAMDIDDMFGSGGIYTNSGSRGLSWERPCSFEIIYPDGRRGKQVNCGVRIQGGAFRSHGLTKKHSLRFLFKAIYGPTKLRHPFLKGGGAERFDTLTFRANSNDGWQWSGAGDKPLYVRDSLGREIMLAMGQPASHETFVHLFINGVYWGLYNPVERPDHSFSSIYVAGEKEEWDAISNGSATNGDKNAWNTLVSRARAGLSSNTAYFSLCGKDPDGTPNPALETFIDPVNFADYMITNLYLGNTDWPNKNYWMGRRRVDATGFKFYMWDSEWSLDLRSSVNENRLGVNVGIAEPWPFMRQNAEFRLLVADRLHKHFFNGGPLYVDPARPGWDPAHPERNMPASRFMELINIVSRAVVAESARWGDQHASTPYTRDEHWARERDDLLANYFPRRSAIVLNQFKSAGLYPNVDPPIFSQHGGLIDLGFELAAQSEEGSVYYTIDGSDPRLVGGDVSPTAGEAGAVERTTLVDVGDTVRYHVPANGALGISWTSRTFADGGWMVGTTGVGYERSSGYEDLISTDVESVLYDQNTTIYLRIPFQFSGARPPLLKLLMKYDDGFIAYLNGQEIASANVPDDPDWSSGAPSSHSDSLATVFQEFDVSEHAGALVDGENVLAIHAMNRTSTNGDFLIVPQLDAAVPLEGQSIVLDETTTVRARVLAGETWSALNEATFVYAPLRITEVMYHPVDPGPGFDDDDIEFVEVKNIGSAPVDLAGVTISGGIEFDFTDGDVATLLPGDFVVVVNNFEGFEAVYDPAGIQIAGEFDGNLGNDSEVLTLSAHGFPVLEFAYSDAWYPETDSGGHSLVIADAEADLSEWNVADGWVPSAEIGGSPGTEDGDFVPRGWQISGDANQDGSVDIADALSMLRRLFGGGVLAALPCEDGALPTEGANVIVFDVNEDAGFNVGDAVFLLNYLFAEGPPPGGGLGCQRVENCVSVCRP